MRSQDLCWWLQGYFELHGGLQTLDQDQVGCIRRHLELAKTVEGGRLVGFAAWLDGLFVGIDAGLKIEDCSLTSTIKKKLSDEFEHVIDKQFEKDAADKAKLDAVHRPRPPHYPPDGPLPRC